MHSKEIELLLSSFYQSSNLAELQAVTVETRMSNPSYHLYRQLTNFDPDTETMSAYLERVDIFFQAKGIAEEKQVGIFLSLLGAKIYSLLCDLVAPAKPKEKTLAQLTKILQTHFEPKPLKITEQFNFY